MYGDKYTSLIWLPKNEDSFFFTNTEVIKNNHMQIKANGDVYLETKLTSATAFCEIDYTFYPVELLRCGLQLKG